MSGRPASQSPLRRKSIASNAAAMAGGGAAPSASGIPRAIMNTKRAQSLAASEIARGMASGWGGESEGQGSSTMRRQSHAAVAVAPASDTTANLTRSRPAGPRKSSIRSRPPQIFASPTGMTRSPTAPQQQQGRRTTGRQSMFAAPGADSATESPGPPPASSSSAPASPAPRKKRRVTFSNRQERTDFMRDEPTMHIRPGIETDMTSASHSTASSSGSGGDNDQDSLIPRLSGYGDGLDDDGSGSEEESDDDSEEEEESSEVDADVDEERLRQESADESAVDMELTTIDDRDDGDDDVDDGEDRTMDLTAAIASMSDPNDDSGSGSDGDGSMSMDMDLTRGGGATAMTDGEQSMALDGDVTAASQQSMAMDLTNITAATRKSRRSSAGMASMDMDMSADGGASGGEDDISDGSLEMDITGVSTATGGGEGVDETEGEDESEDDADVDREPTSDARPPPAIDSLPPPPPSTSLAAAKSRFRARDSMAALTNFGRRAATAARSSVGGAQSAGTAARPSVGASQATTGTGMPRSSVGAAQATTAGIPRPSVGGAQTTTATGIPRPSSSSMSPAKREPVTTTASPSSPSRTTPSRTTPSHSTPSRFRRSIVGGLSESPSKSPARRVQVPVDVTAPHATPLRSAATAARSSIVAAVLDSGNDDDDAGDGVGDEKENDNRPGDVAAAAASPALTLSEFFSLSGMNFHDDTRALKVRVVPPASSSSSSSKSSPASLDPLRVKAMAGCVPMLESLAQACRELKKSVSDGSLVLKDIEEKFVESPPDLVRELLSLSNEAEKREMESQFKLQKQAARAIAREGYLGWCLDNQYGPEIIAALTKTRDALQGDVDTVEGDAARMRQDILPALRERRDMLRDQVARFRARQATIDATPAADLEVLHSGMAELLPELQSRRAVQREKTAALERIRGKLQEDLARKADLERSIESHRRVCEQIQGYTRAEASRLAAEIRHIERLHLWKVRAASLGKLHLEHDGVFDIVIALGARGQVESVELAVGVGVGVDGIGILTRQVAASLQTEFALVQEQLAAAAADAAADTSMDSIQVPQLVRHVSTVWTSVRHLQSEIKRLGMLYPLVIHADNDSDGVTASPRSVVSADILLPAHRTRLSLTFDVDLDSLVYESGDVVVDDDDDAGQNSAYLVELANSLRLTTVYGEMGDEDIAAARKEIVQRLINGRGRDAFVLGASGQLARVVGDVVEGGEARAR